MKKYQNVLGQNENKYTSKLVKTFLFFITHSLLFLIQNITHSNYKYRYHY